MFSIIGILVVFGAIIGGFLMEKGALMVLVQPAELVIIGGAAIGTVLVGNPPHILKKLIGAVMGAFTGSKYSQKRYLDTLKMLYELFNLARRSGLSAIESDIEDPSKSKVFSAYPAIIKDHHVRDFICDTLRTASAGTVEPFDIESPSPYPRSTPWPTPCPASASSPRSSASSSPWARSAARPKRSAITLPRLSSVRSSAS
jgi:chemotaxis protein MotA